MGGGGGRWLDFGATYGSGKLPIRFAVEFDSEEDGTTDSGLEKLTDDLRDALGDSK